MWVMGQIYNNQTHIIQVQVLVVFADLYQSAHSVCQSILIPLMYLKVI